MEMAAVSSPVHHWQHADIESQHHDEGQALIGRTVIAGPSHWHMPAVRTVTADRIDQTVTVGQCSLSRVCSHSRNGSSCSCSAYPSFDAAMARKIPKIPKSLG
jgi:hypothetical protein